MWAIRQVFTDRFKSLYEPYTPCADSDFQKTTEELLQCNSVGPFPFIDIATINVCISSLKYRKMHGHDGISNEHNIIIHTIHQFYRYISVCFLIYFLDMVLFLVITVLVSFYLC